MNGAKAGYRIPWNPKWLLALGIGMGMVLVFDTVFPGSGVPLAAGIALAFLLNHSGIATEASLRASRLRRSLT